MEHAAKDCLTAKSLEILKILKYVLPTLQTSKSSFGKIQTVKYTNIPTDVELGENVEKMITATRTEVVDMHVSLIFLRVVPSPQETIAP